VQVRQPVVARSHSLMQQKECSSRPGRSRVALLPRTIWIDGWIWLSASPRTARRSTATSTEQVRGGIEPLLYAKRRRWGDGRSATATGRRAEQWPRRPRVCCRVSSSDRRWPARRVHLPRHAGRPADRISSSLATFSPLFVTFFISIVWCVPCANY
jgi:hypothetical protein